MPRKPTKNIAADDQVLTPGGYRRKQLVQEVKEGEAVRFDNDGKASIVKREESHSRS